MRTAAPPPARPSSRPRRAPMSTRGSARHTAPHTLRTRPRGARSSHAAARRRAAPARPAFAGLLPLPQTPVAPGLLFAARRRGSSVLLGGAFAVCAAPCVAPILASTLVLAADATTVAQAAVLLFAYSLGLAIPFLLTGMLFAPAMGSFRWLRDRFRYVEVAGGLVLAGLGLLLFFGKAWWLRTLFDRVV